LRINLAIHIQFLISRKTFIMRHILTTLSLLLLANGAYAEESHSAKSLFFGEDNNVIAVSTTQKDNSTAASVATAPQQANKHATTVAYKKPVGSANIGASYFIRLKKPDGSTRDVLASQKFKTGDHIQLGLKINRPSYIYIMNEGPDGKVTQIYPQPGNNNFIDAMGVVFFPAKGSFEFDNIPGTEQLLVYMSSVPMQKNITEIIRTASPDIISAPFDTVASTACPAQVMVNVIAPQKSNENIQLASAAVEYASKGMNFSADEVSSACNNAGSAPAYASKGMVFSEDPEPEMGGQVASYVVKTVAKADANLYLKIKLVHQ
jgi:hypothetical protein